MKGRFIPKNPKKYKGDSSDITYRSSWEFTMMMKFDSNPNVVEWSSEEVVVPYRTVLDEAYEARYKISYKRWHRYYVDFYVKLVDRSGKTQRLLIEVKPKHETVKPDPANYPKNNRVRFKRDMVKWTINEAKWKAAREYAADHGMKFEIYTEDRIYGK